MSEFDKLSTDGGATFMDVEDSKAVHWAESKGYVGKNLFSFTLESLKAINTQGTWNNNVYTINGISYTVNSDNTITASGQTSSNSAWLRLSNSFSLITGGNYTLSDSLDTHNNKRFLRIGNATDGYLAGTVASDNVNFTATATMTSRISVEANTDLSTAIIFKPMIRLASISDSTYEPYLTPNTDLMSYADNTILGAHNLLEQKIVYKNHALNGITWNTNADGSITANGTATSESVIDLIVYADPINLPAGDYIVSGGLTNDQYIYINGCKNGSYVYTYANNGAGETSFSYPQGKDVDGFKASIRINAGQTVNNVVFYPMIRLASDTDSNYAPFAYSNRDLTNLVRPFRKGDTYSISLSSFEPITGHITSGAAEIMTAIPLPRGFNKDNISSITLSYSTGANMSGRGVSGYIIPLDTALSSQNYVIDCPINMSGIHRYIPLRIRKTNSGAFDTTNNTPISVAINGTLTFTFS